MKIMLVIGLAAIALCGCQPKRDVHPAKWEYTTLRLKNDVDAAADEERKKQGSGAAYRLKSRDEDLAADTIEYGGELRKLGEDGWELVGVVSEVETRWPKEGKMNVRSHGALLIFKRPAQ